MKRAPIETRLVPDRDELLAKLRIELVCMATHFENIREIAAEMHLDADTLRLAKGAIDSMDALTERAFESLARRAH